MTGDSDQPAGLLTNAQRAYLRGEKDYRPSVKQDVDRRIRKRISASIDDVSLLVEKLGLEELKKVTEDNTSSWSDLVALVVIADEFRPDYGIGVQGADPPREPEATIRHGIRTGLRRLGQTWEEIIVKIERGDPLDELAQKDLADLSFDEIDHLLAAGMITRKERTIEEVRRLQNDDAQMSQEEARQLLHDLLNEE